MKTYHCKNCGSPFQAREADRARGWARFCSKSCKASEQTRRTGRSKPESDSFADVNAEALYSVTGGWDDHKSWK